MPVQGGIPVGIQALASTVALAWAGDEAAAEPVVACQVEVAGSRSFSVAIALRRGRRLRSPYHGSLVA